MSVAIAFCVYALIAFVIAGHLTEDDDDSHALGLFVAVTWPLSLPMIVAVASGIRLRERKTGAAPRAVPHTDNEHIEPPKEAA